MLYVSRGIITSSSQPLSEMSRNSILKDEVIYKEVKMELGKLAKILRNDFFLNWLLVQCVLGKKKKTQNKSRFY